jgi:phosphatidylinositol kinase/protein kinase (PI-3  family)
MRYAECALRDVDLKAEEPVDNKVRDLIELASNPEKLCMMPASYQAWL